MIIETSHETSYRYNSAVRLDLQTIRLKPRADARQRILHFDLHVSPDPTFRSEGIDEDGNVMVWVRIDGSLDRFDVKTFSRVETTPSRPEIEMLSRGVRKLPMELPGDEGVRLQRYFVPPWVGPEVKEYSERIADSTHRNTLDFLETLAFRIHKDHAYRARIEGPPLTPDVTLARREGSCRDFTVLFMESCRAQGIATRFVSGYHVRQRDNAGRELHAWTEAYLPGFGWQGYDPTIGQIVLERHVPVATASNPSGAAPVTGSFWGNNVTSTLFFKVDARILTANPPATF
ncbi:MAG: transglutaminase family protein [Euryarchaeota archaeon]|nr:transglutaminase family protein [Euryarchaeota archaeon]